MARELGKNFRLFCVLLFAFFSGATIADTQWGLIVQESRDAGNGSVVKIQNFSMLEIGKSIPVSSVAIPYSSTNLPPVWSGFLGYPNQPQSWVLFGFNSTSREIWFLNAGTKNISKINTKSRTPLVSVTAYSGDEVLALTEDGEGFIMTSDPKAPIKTISLKDLKNLYQSKRFVDAVRINEDKVIVLTDNMVSEIEIPKVTSLPTVKFNIMKAIEMPGFKWSQAAKLTARASLVWISGNATKTNEKKAISGLAFVDLKSESRTVEFQRTDFQVYPLSVVAPVGELFYLLGEEVLALPPNPEFQWRDAYLCSRLDRSHKKIAEFPISLDSQGWKSWGVFARSTASNFWNTQTDHAQMWRKALENKVPVSDDPQNMESVLRLLVDVVQKSPVKIQLSRRIRSAEFAVAFSQSLRTDYLGRRFQPEVLWQFGLRLSKGYNPLIEWDSSQGESTTDLVAFAESLWQVIQVKKDETCANSFL